MTRPSKCSHPEMTSKYSFPNSVVLPAVVLEAIKYVIHLGVMEERKRTLAWLRRDTTVAAMDSIWPLADDFERERHWE